MSFWPSKKKEKSMKSFTFSIKEVTTFGGDVWYYPMYKEDGLMGSWCNIVRINGRNLISIPLFNPDPIYACTTLDEAKGHVNEYRAMMEAKLFSEVKKVEYINLENLTEETENENA